MSDFAQPEWILALLALPVVAALAAGAFARRRALLGRLIDAPLRDRIVAAAPASKRWGRLTLVLLGGAALIVGLARPLGAEVPREIQRAGRDVVFLIDVSNSMRAEDIAPSRLERAKLIVRDAISALEGDRVAIVPFAGTAVVKCPLTLDYGFARFVLEGLSTESVARGGSMVGDAVRTTLETLFDDDTEGRFRDIVIVSDGEDMGSFPVEAAQAAGERGVRIIALGLGDPNEGSLIPSTAPDGRDYMTHRGVYVRTTLESESLREMAQASSGGAYLEVGTGTINFDEVYADLIRTSERRELEQTLKPRRAELFQIALALALAFLGLEATFNDRR